MTPDDDPNIVSLESRRRQRLADDKKRLAGQRKQAKAHTSHERAINWRRVPLLLAAVVLFLLFGWLVRQAGGLLNPFH